MIRQHQFNKVEMVSITTPDHSPAEHARMTNCAEENPAARPALSRRRALLRRHRLRLAQDARHRSVAARPEHLSRDFQRLQLRATSRLGACRRASARRTPRRCSSCRRRRVGLAVGRALIAVIENYQRTAASARRTLCCPTWAASIVSVLLVKGMEYETIPDNAVGVSGT